MVLKVICPTVRLPAETTSRKRPRGDMGWSEEASSYGSSSSGRDDRRRNVDSSKRDEINALFSSVKDFSSSSFLGIKKQQHKEDILTKLGAPNVKQQKMPFKMRLGLDYAKKQRDEKTKIKAKDSGVVLAVTSKKNRNDRSRRDSSTNDKKQNSRASSASRSKNQSSSFGINTKSGVMHLSKKRLPDKLVRSRK